MLREIAQGSRCQAGDVQGLILTQPRGALGRGDVESGDHEPA